MEADFARIQKEFAPHNSLHISISRNVEIVCFVEGLLWCVLHFSVFSKPIFVSQKGMRLEKEFARRCWVGSLSSHMSSLLSFTMKL